MCLYRPCDVSTPDFGKVLEKLLILERQPKTIYTPLRCSG